MSRGSQLAALGPHWETAMHGDQILWILITGHAELLPLGILSSLSQASKRFDVATRQHLLAWRALQVLATKCPAMTPLPTVGAIGATSWSSACLVSKTLGIYYRFVYAPKVRAAILRQMDEGDVFSSSEGGSASPARTEQQSASDCDGDFESGQCETDNVEIS